MIIFPAVDIQKGKAVRLKKGRADESTVFNDDPVAAALHWQNQGASWLHVVDLDGAFDGTARSFSIVQKICEKLSIPVQLGGGIRDEETARNYIESGVNRLIIGTMAIEDPKGFSALCARFPGRIGVSLDAENGVLKTRGWVSASTLTVDDLLPRLTDAGCAFLIYTDIARDGMQSGANLTMLESLLTKTTIPVLSAGGVATMEDIRAIYPLHSKGPLEGVISGRALYEGTLDLREANAWIAAQS
ncbi:MAG: 1-(5-phosphoribosyl)-5-[(5-phosphoribosylamino)methylideneamino]imidazole-4-carboxamide isomerase [Desulfovibrio sp.]|nr:1-(5-phosphoribosyl)-5-[(5-phosphoribosylamino)methylideneamino]imidazole-4-carboxamide isomerase [Desulfovibrio sp.]